LCNLEMPHRVVNRTLLEAGLSSILSGDMSRAHHMEALCRLRRLAFNVLHVLPAGPRRNSEEEDAGAFVQDGQAKQRGGARIPFPFVRNTYPGMACRSGRLLSRVFGILLREPSLLHERTVGLGRRHGTNGVCAMAEARVTTVRPHRRLVQKDMQSKRQRLPSMLVLCTE